MLEVEQPIFAQLYLLIDRMEGNGIMFDREDKLTGNNEEQALRNLYITFKAFPTFEKLATPVMYKQSCPIFNHGSQFPVMMNAEVIDKLDRFTFVLEVWD